MVQQGEYGTPVLDELFDEQTENDQSKDFTVPDGEYWRVHSVAIDLSTNAGGSSRLLGVQILRGSDVQATYMAGVGVAGGVSNALITFAAGVAAFLTLISDKGMAPLPAMGLLVRPGDIVRVSILDNGDGADDMLVRGYGDRISLV